MRFSAPGEGYSELSPEHPDESTSSPCSRDAAETIIERYLDGMDRALSGRQGTKAEALRELRVGLTDAADAGERRGMDRAQAERVAVREVGSVEEVAPSLQSELCFREGRRIAWLLFILVGVQLALAHFGWQHDGDVTSDSFTLSATYLIFARAVDWFQLVAVGVALGAVFAFGPGGRKVKLTQRVTRVMGLLVMSVLTVKSLSSIVLVWAPLRKGVEISALSVLITAFVSVVPTLYVMYSAWRCWRDSRV